jgi:proline iminopeptidase
MKNVNVLSLMFAGLFIPMQSAESPITHQIYVGSFSNINLYPSYAPYHEEHVKVSALHELYCAQFGNPEGIPVVVVHGGPGAGCCFEWSGFFDPNYYRVIMFDQRGSGKSMPAGELRENSTQHLVVDMELLRSHLGINSWILFGGSWGTTLSLLYAQQYPDYVRGMILRGVFLARKSDYEHSFSDAKLYYPECWDEMVQDMSAEEHADLYTTFYTRIMNTDPAIHMPATHALEKFNSICGALLPSQEGIQFPADGDASMLASTRVCLHYCIHDYFLQGNQIVDAIHIIQNIPTIIVQGRHDMICPPIMAHELYKLLPQSTLWIVPDAGHFSSELPIARGLCHAMDVMKGHHV